MTPKPISDKLHTVIGGSGALGRATIAELRRRGLTVRAITQARDVPGVTTIHANITDPAALTSACDGSTHIYVCSAVKYTTEDWKRDWPAAMFSVIQAARKHGAKVIFGDNMYMYGPPPLPVPMTETAPQEPSSHKGRVRKEVASILLTAHERGDVQAVIGRAADFYGPGSESLLYVTVLSRQLAGHEPQWIGSPTRLHSFTHVGDAGAALVWLALDEGAYGDVWHLPTVSPPLTVGEYAARLAQLSGGPARVQRLPKTMLSVGGIFVPIMREMEEMAYQMDSDYVFSSAKFNERFPNFSVTPYADGLNQMVNYFRKASGK